MVGGDDDDGVVLELVACECGEDFCHAIVELTGATVVERADLIDLRRRQGFPFRFEVGAADELIDVEVDAIAVGAAVGGIGEHAHIGFGAAVGQVIAGIEHMPEERFALRCHICEALFDAFGDHLRRDELRERFQLRENAIAEGVVEIEWHHEMGHHHRLAHVDLEVVEARHRDVFKAERNDFVIPCAPVADGGAVVVFFAQHAGDWRGFAFGFFDRFTIGIHLADAVAVRVA